MNDQNLVNKPVDVERLIADLREIPLDMRKASLDVYGLCIDAADRLANDQRHIEALQAEINALQKRLELSNAERDANTQRMIELEQGKKWIPVTERLPENGEPVLINYIGNDDGKMHSDGVAVWVDWGCLWWEGSLKDCDTEVAVPITHWMPLPEPPEVE